MSSCQVLSFLAPISHMYIMIMMEAINGIDCNMTQKARAKIDHTYPLMKSWKCPGFEKTYNIKANQAMKYPSREGYFIEQSSHIIQQKAVYKLYLSLGKALRYTRYILIKGFCTHCRFVYCGCESIFLITLTFITSKVVVPTPRTQSLMEYSLQMLSPLVLNEWQKRVYSRKYQSMV